jgi:peptidyl-prolyl cis-trans isomerase D
MPSLDPKLLDSPEARYATLERWCATACWPLRLKRSNLTTSDQRLAQELQANESIASLRKPDGKLDMDRYRQLVGAQGMTPEMFENEVRNDVSRAR